jgi:hypothetical protein
MASAGRIKINKIYSAVILCHASIGKKNRLLSNGAGWQHCEEMITEKNHIVGIARKFLSSFGTYVSSVLVGRWPMAEGCLKSTFFLDKSCMVILRSTGLMPKKSR